MQIHCPICGTRCRVAEDFPHRPFCSERCKTIDLGNWLDEAYRFSRPVHTEDLEDDEIKLR